MRRFLRTVSFTVILGLSLPAGAQNVQPFSTSMVECSVIYSEVVDLGRQKGRDPSELARYERLADRYDVAALAQARAEGRRNPERHLAGIRTEKQAKWDGHMSNILLVGENKDWLDYCRSFARTQGIWRD